MMLLFRRIANLFRRNRLTEEIEAELRAHIEMRTADNVAAGMSQDEAKRDAAIRFGNLGVMQERTAGVWINQFAENSWRDVGYAARQLRHSPGFALTAMLTVALAISTNIVVFGPQFAFARALTETGSDCLFNVAQGPYGYDSQSYPDYIDYRDGNTSFGKLAAYRFGQVGLTMGGAAYKCWDYEVSGNYFDLVGVRSSFGRFFHSADEHGPDSAPYVVLSDSFWRSHFGADPRVVGKTVRLNQHPFTVIGVAPATFHGTDLFMWPDIWVPMVNERQLEGYDFLTRRFSHGIWIIGLLRPGVSVRHATENLNAIAAHLVKLYPSSDDGMKARLVKAGLMGEQLGDAARAFLSAIMGMALLVLLAACTNFAGIFAARSADRSRELAIRLSIGADRCRILRQLLTESLVIAILGGITASLLATALLRSLDHWQPIAGMPIHFSVTPGARVYLLAALLSFSAGVLPGLISARQLWHTDLVGSIKNAVSESFAGRHLSFRDLLLGIQIAVCALLLTTALVAVRGLDRSLHAPLGFDQQGVVLAETDMHMANHADASALAIQKRMLKKPRVSPEFWPSA